MRTGKEEKKSTKKIHPPDKRKTLSTKRTMLTYFSPPASHLLQQITSVKFPPFIQTEHEEKKSTTTTINKLPSKLQKLLLQLLPSC